MFSSSSSNPCIELEGVYKKYGDRLALNGVSLKVEKGVMGLLGPNGSGKSTLIKSLLGLVKIDRGKGNVLGLEWPAKAREIRDLVGYLPEDDCYISGLQGVESVQLAGRLSGLPALESLRRAHEVMDFCDIGQERYRQVETYSTGMRQKLKFAQTLVHDPSLIILDEPTTGLDPVQREGFLNRIRVLANDFHKTVILSTHILPDVRHVCDSVVILVQGRVRVADSLARLSQPVEPGLNVILSEGKEAFLMALRNREITAVLGTRDEVRIVGYTAGSPDEIWQCAAESGAIIRSLEPARASLDQLFMDAVRDGIPSAEEPADAHY